MRYMNEPISSWRMWRRVGFVWTDVSEDRVASIFRVEESASEEPACSCRLSSPKRRFTQKLHGATSQKTAFFIVTAVKTSNLNNIFFFDLTTVIIIGQGYKLRSFKSPLMTSVIVIISYIIVISQLSHTGHNTSQIQEPKEKNIITWS
jgi:hypothetical protein